jgi:hypothetical protein
MNRRTRLRRTGILCLHALRNLAFQRAMADARRTWESKQFLVTAHNNFLDVAILEWCKLFTDRAGVHHWRKSVTDQGAFSAALLAHVRCSEEEYRDYALSIKTYRDTFVAHLDEANDIDIPTMSIARLSTQFLYSWLLFTEDDCNAYHDAPQRPEEFYAVAHAHARKLLRGEA